MTQRKITVLPNDIFLVSYPKSGNTWMRFLIGSLYHNKKMDWINVQYFVPDIYSQSDKDLLGRPFIRILKSHSNYDPRYKKVIYIVRDVREIVISFYFHQQKFNKKRFKDKYGNFNGFFNAFVSGKIFPGLWSEHVLSWIIHKDKVENGFLLLRYEDLIKNTFQEVSKIVPFLNLEKTKEEINEAINWSSFNNMKKLETKHGFFDKTDRTIPFVREGKINSWESHLTAEQQQIMIDVFGNTLKLMGYET